MNNKKSNTSTNTNTNLNNKSSTTSNKEKPTTTDKTITKVSIKNQDQKSNSSEQNLKACFIKKVNIAKTVFDYSDENKDSKLKGERMTAINELIEMLSDQRHVITLFIPNIELVIEMITKNIFRPLPLLRRNDINVGVSETGVETEEQETDPAWPYLRGIYEIFLQLIINEACEDKLLKQFITKNFIQEFLQLFDSEESQERDFLKNILHRLYAKVVPRRKMIRKSMTDCFHILIHESHKFNGTSELLDILASIISGFQAPLRDEHIVFFKSIIIPLHKVQTSTLYFDNLIRCSMLYLTKDSSLAVPLLEGILKYWPFANHVKELLFLQELPEVLEFCDPPEKIKPVVFKLFKRVVRCITGLHLQVADSAMCLFESDSFIQILKYYKSISFNMLVPVIVEISDNHWHKMLQESLTALKDILHKIDPTTYVSALDNPDQKKSDKVTQPTEERIKLESKWKTFTINAKNKNKMFIEQDIPFKDDTVLCDFNKIYRGVYDKEQFLNS